ncbi:hypothetical protein [Mycobacterium sp.]|uniref:hypothetical protein n=1 Tax=Mycobacterium sp. TaxID=1785 RepID=UPI003BB09533
MFAPDLVAGGAAVALPGEQVCDLGGQVLWWRALEVIRHRAGAVVVAQDCRKWCAAL